MVVAVKVQDQTPLLPGMSNVEVLNHWDMCAVSVSFGLD